MKVSGLRLLGVAVAAALAAVRFAEARSIGVNAASVYGTAFMWSLAPGTSEGVVPQANWNNIGTANQGEQCGYLSTNDLIGSDGRLTGAGVRLTLSPPGNTIIGQAGPATGFQLFKGGLTSHYGRAPFLSVSNIPFAKYDVVTYVWNLSGNMGGVLVGSDGNGPVNKDISVTNDGGVFSSFDDATDDGIGNYIKWTRLTGRSFTLTMKGNGERRGFTALQILGYAELSTGALLIVR